ncbi:MAG: hypothetical protein E6K18_06080 [Methanobacteriota archaeon]|nr:MAG: hypothetical protein E6K18_06080 [Euryarchaeota archaeon]
MTGPGVPMGSSNLRPIRIGAVIVAAVAVMAGLVLIPSRVSAATVVCGTLTNSAVWTAAGNPYFVTCGVLIAQGVTLTIEAGVTVLASPRAVFGVAGALIAAGTANAPVRFDSNATSPAPDDWYGISVWPAAYVQLRGLVLQHSRYGLEAVGVTGQGLLVRDSEFANNSGYGIMAGGGVGTAYPILQHVFVHDNGDGISANGTMAVVDSTISANRFRGIAAWSGGPIYVSNTSVTDNGYGGISLAAGAPPAPYVRSIITCSEFARNTVGISIEADPSGPGANVATIYRNNFIRNTVQASDGTAGNFWSDYTGTDSDGDGFGDVPYAIDADSVDRYPYIAPVAGCPGGGPPGPVDSPPGPATPLDAQLTGNQLRDVTMTWDLSPDDGAGERDVVAYELYGSSTFDSRGTGYSLLATLPQGTASYRDTGAGMRDPLNHFYRLVTKDATGHTAASADQFAKYTRTVPAGEQLLSVPIDLSDQSIDNVLRGVDYQVARTYVNPAGQGKNWLTQDKGKPWGDLTTADETMALWVLVNTASDLVVAGLVRHSLTVHLDVGWNFVGYASFVSRTIAEALAGANHQTVEGFDAANPPFFLRRLADTDSLRPGDGLWIHVSGPFDWSLTN